MKSSLINRYFELRSKGQWAALASNGSRSLVIVHQMLRIDAILFERYGYDVSLTRKN